MRDDDASTGQPGAGNAQVRNLTIAAAELDISGRRITIPEDLPSTWWG